MKKTILINIGIAVLLMAIVLPAITHAQNIFNVVPCGNESDPQIAARSCTLSHLFQLINNVIKVLVILSFPATMIAWTWVGILLLTSGGDSGRITRAKGIAIKVLWGFIIILSAWLLVYTILNALVDPRYNLLKK
jgi:hypothetical protein